MQNKLVQAKIGCNDEIYWIFRVICGEMKRNDCGVLYVLFVIILVLVMEKYWYYIRILLS